MSRKGPNESRARGGLAGREQGARVLRADVVAQVLIVGQSHRPAVLRHARGLKTQVYVEGNRLR